MHWSYFKFQNILGNFFTWLREFFVINENLEDKKLLETLRDLRNLFQFYVRSVGMAYDLVVSIPVLIGNIPIVSTIQPLQSQERHLDLFRATLPPQLNSYPHLRKRDFCYTEVMIIYTSSTENFWH